MAITQEQLEMMLRVNNEGVKNMMEGMMNKVVDGMKKMMEEAKKGGEKEKDKEDKDEKLGKGRIKVKDFEGKRKLNNKEDWEEAQWEMMVTLKVENGEFYKKLKEVENKSEKEVDEMIEAWEIEDKKGEVVVQRAAEWYGILCGWAKGDAQRLVKGTKEGSGIKAWWNLHKNYNPRTAAGTLINILRAVRPTAVKDIRETSKEVQEWEIKWKEAGEHVEGISDTGRVAILMGIVPEDVQEAVAQQMGEEDKYYQVKEHMLGIVNMRLSRQEFRTMDVGMAEKGNEEGDVGRW